MEEAKDENERNLGGRREGRDINTQIKGGETLKKQLAVIIGAILAISAVAVIPYCLAGAAISGGRVFHGNDDGHPHGLANFTRYDFNVRTGTAMWAYGKQIGENPTASEPSEEFSQSDYEKIKVDDDIRKESTTDTDGKYAAHRFNFSIIENPSDIRKINVTWEGIGDHDSADATDGAKLYIYNFTSGAYEELASTTSNQEVTLTGEKTSGISSYINSGNVTILVNQTSAHSDPDTSRIETDYVKLVVTP